MTRIIMHGCNGKMGQMISGICSEMQMQRSLQELILQVKEKMPIRYLRILQHVM